MSGDGSKEICVNEVTKGFFVKYLSACICKILFMAGLTVFLILSVFGAPFAIASIGAIFESITGECRDIYADCFNTEVEFCSKDVENKVKARIFGIFAPILLIVLLVAIVIINIINTQQHN